MKLTKEMREDIIRVCTNSTFKVRDQDHERVRTSLADAVYVHAFGDIEKLAKKLPAGWLSCHRSIEITMEGFSSHWRGRADIPSSSLKTSKDRLFPVNIGTAFKIDSDHLLYGQAQEVIKDFHSIYKAKDDLRTQLRTLLFSVNTLARLKEVWPEGDKYFPVETAKQASVVPYDLTISINKMMNISGNEKSKEKIK